MIPETPPYNNYTGDGVTTQFDFDFYIESASQLVVSHTASDSTITTLVKDTDYSIHEIGNENGSYITFPIAGSTYSVLSSSEVITLQLSLPISQQSEYGTSSELDLESLEYSFDYLTRIAQIQNRQLQRSIKVAEGSGIDTEALVKSVNVIYANIDNINAVNNNSSNINTVSGNTNNINTVSGNISSVNSVAGDISNVNAVAGDLTNIDAVKANKTNIDTVAGVSSNVTTVAGISSAVTTVSGISSAVSAVSSNASNINAVAADISNVNAVAGDLTNIDAVNANKTNIDAVKNNASNINTVAGISSAVSNVSGISSAVTAVNSNASNINAVSADITNVNLVANDLENIDAASGYATSSKRYAVGLPSEPPEGSAKYWAGQAAQGQIQADWSQSDNTKKDYIKNKPTKVSDFVDDTAINPVDKADTLTGLTATASELNVLDGVTANTSEINYLGGVTSAIQTQINNKSNLIWYADRDFEYRHPKYMTADKSTITILAGTAIRLKNNSYFYTATDRTYQISSILDTGSVANGKDYYFYLNNSGELIASLSDTNPSGYAAADVVQIGGAHTLCVAVTSGNAPALLNDSFWGSHPAIGYNAADFIPNTIWTPAWRSNAKTGNKGMALIEYYGFDKFWVDIYLQSGTGTATASSYSGTITNSRQCILHEYDMRMVGKSLPKDWQFSIFSEGSNQATNIAGSAIPAARLTGGYTDTAGKRMISGFFIECCCGYLWQWGDEIAPVGGSGWSAYGDTRRGASYGMPYVLLFGGAYGNSGNCGSWARACSDNRTVAYAYHGGRGVSLHIEKQHS